ncbi:hypothetical protein N9403_02365 [Gammaproteobacteria bacterium]|nr:hypothetical protein [Gammaproteobacteria bacterium]
MERSNDEFAALIEYSMVLTLMSWTALPNFVLLQNIKSLLLKECNFFGFRLILEYQTINE